MLIKNLFAFLTLVSVFLFAGLEEAKADSCTGKTVSGQIQQLQNFSGYFDGENHYGFETVVVATIVGESETTVMYDEISDTFATYSFTNVPHCGNLSLGLIMDATPNGSGGYDAGMKVVGFMNNYLTPDHGPTWYWSRPLNVPLQQNSSVEIFNMLFYRN